MPITVYHRPPAKDVAEAANQGAARLAYRRNLDDAIQRQMQADSENAQLGLQYANLYQRAASQDKAMAFQAADSAQDRAARLAAQGQAFDQTVAMTGLQHQLGEESAASAAMRTAERDAAHAQTARENFDYELGARDKKRMDNAQAVLDALRQQQADGRWSHDPQGFAEQEGRILSELNGIQGLAVPKPKLPRLSERLKNEGTIDTLDNGLTMIQQPDGTIKFQMPPKTGEEAEAASLSKAYDEAYKSLTTSDDKGNVVSPNPQDVIKHVKAKREAIRQMQSEQYTAEIDAAMEMYGTDTSKWPPALQQKLGTSAAQVPATTGGA